MFLLQHHIFIRMFIAYRNSRPFSGKVDQQKSCLIDPKLPLHLHYPLLSLNKI